VERKSSAEEEFAMTDSEHGRGRGHGESESLSRINMVDSLWSNKRATAYWLVRVEDLPMKTSGVRAGMAMPVEGIEMIPPSVVVLDWPRQHGRRCEEGATPLVGMARRRIRWMTSPTHGYRCLHHHTLSTGSRCHAALDPLRGNAHLRGHHVEEADTSGRAVKA
jgi:hypothetical protein